MVIALVFLSRQKTHCKKREVCDVCALWFYTSTCIAHNEIKKSVPPAKKKFIKKKEKSLGVRRSMAFWGGGCGDGWSLHLHFIVEGTEWGFLEGSLNRVGWLRAWLWMLVICNFTAQKSGCFFLCPPPPMNGKRTKPYRQGVSIHLLGIWMLSIGRLMDFTSVEPTRWSMDFRVVELMRCWTPCYIMLVSIDHF